MKLQTKAGGAAVALALALTTGTGCGTAIVCSQNKDALVAGKDYVCQLDGFSKRDYLLHVPTSYVAGTPAPVVLVLHGGGGKAENTQKVGCPEGDEKGATCMNALADQRGYVVVYPNGTGNAVAPNVRTWNAGGGSGDWQCVSGVACKNGVDDIAYFDALLDDLSRAVDVDQKRIFATGISNGGAMSHRLACERANRIAAIAPVAGANQLEKVQGCQPSRPVPVLHIHGTADPCWAFAGGSSACAQDDGKNKASVADTINGWVARNGCLSAARSEEIPDAVDDGTSARREIYEGCRDDATVILLRVDNGGHTWPGGLPYLGEDRVGPVCRDFSGNQEMLDFFDAHPLP